MSDGVALEIVDGVSGPLEAAGRAFDDGLYDLATATAAALLDRARTLASGEMLRDVDGAYEDGLWASARRTDRGVVASLGDDAVFAGLLEFGGRTAAHEIRADGSEALRFFAGGADAEAVFAKVVHDPGATIAPHPVLRTALADEAGSVSAAAEALLARFAETFA